MENKKTFGEFIYKKRKEANLTQREFADMLYVTESAVSKWERGVSYPDITLIKPICEILNISEHELIIASNDLQKNNELIDAKKFRNIRSLYVYTLLIIYGLALFSCFVINLAVQHKLSWFFIVFGSVLVAFTLTLLPVLVKKNKGLITLIGVFGSINLLLLISNIYSGGNWFFITFVALLFSFSIVFLPLVINNIDFKYVLTKLKLPITIDKHRTLVIFIIDTLLLILLLGSSSIYNNSQSFFTVSIPVVSYLLILPWTMMIVIRYAKINGLFKTSISLFLVAIYSTLTNGIIKMILERKPFELYPINLSVWTVDYINGNIVIITLFVITFIGLLFAIGGIIKAVRK